MRDPVTKLAILDPTTVEADICRVLPDLLTPNQSNQLPLIHYIARISKKTRHNFNASRIIVATNTHLIECRDDGMMKRSVHYPLISEIVIFPDSYFLLRVPREHDLVAKLAKTVETDFFINIIRVARSFLMLGGGTGGSGLTVRGAAGTYKDLKDPVNLAKRDGVEYTIAPVQRIRNLDNRENALAAFLEPPQPPPKNRNSKLVCEIPSAQEEIVLRHPLLDPGKVVPPTADIGVGSPSNPLLNPFPTPNIKSELARASAAAAATTATGAATTGVISERAGAAATSSAAQVAESGATVRQLHSELAAETSKLFTRRPAGSPAAHGPDTSPIVAVEWPRRPGAFEATSAAVPEASPIAGLWHGASVGSPDHRRRTPPHTSQGEHQQAANRTGELSAAAPGRLASLEAEVAILRDELRHMETLRSQEAGELARRRDALQDMELSLRQLREENRTLRTQRATEPGMRPTAAPTTAAATIGGVAELASPTPRAPNLAPQPPMATPQQGANSTGFREASVNGARSPRGMSVRDFEDSVRNKKLSERLVLRQYQIDQKRAAVNAMLNGGSGEYNPELVSDLQDELIQLVRNLEGDLRECELTPARKPVAHQSVAMERMGRTTRTAAPEPPAATPPLDSTAGADHPPPPAAAAAAAAAAAETAELRQQREYAQWYYTYYYPTLVAQQRHQQQHRQHQQLPPSRRHDQLTRDHRHRQHFDPSLPFGAGGRSPGRSRTPKRRMHF